MAAAAAAAAAAEAAEDGLVIWMRAAEAAETLDEASGGVSGVYQLP